MYLDIAVSSSIGERKNNEDNFFAAGGIRTWDDPARTDSRHVEEEEAPAVFAVCDGMGGLSRGEVASWLAMEKLRTCVSALGSGEKSLEDMTLELHAAVVRGSQRCGSPLGAAVVLARVSADGMVEVCNVGDCRAFLFTDGALTQVSLDHTTEQEWKEIGFPSRKDGRLTQYLGMDEEEYALEPYSARVFLPPGGKLLLCSDGVRQRWSDGEITEILARSAGARVAADCLTKETEPGQDNATAIVIGRAE